MPSTDIGYILLVIFVVPGFIFEAVLNRSITGRPLSDLRFVLQALIFSLLIHAAFLTWTLDVRQKWIAGTLLTAGDRTLMFWALTVLIATPAVSAFVAGKLMESARLQPLLEFFGISWSNRLPFCWDWFALKKQGFWLIVEFKDGKKIGGKYEQQSQISQTPLGIANAPRDLFIEELYRINDDDTFGEPIPYNRGAWVSAEEIRSIKIFKE